MKKHQKILVVSLFFLAISHALISIYHNVGLVEGDYFSSGIIVMSDGKVFPTSQRLYSDGLNLYSYDQAGADSYEFHFFREFSIKGYMSYVSQNSGAKNIQISKYTDRDISFNSSYASSPGARLTLSEIRTPYRAKCLYVYELSRVYCYGAKRVVAP